MEIIKTWIEKISQDPESPLACLAMVGLLIYVYWFTKTFGTVPSDKEFEAKR